MKQRRILGIVCVLMGVAAILGARYIKGETEEGRRKISSAQKQVNTGKRLFSLSPATEPIGRTVTGSAQKKIDKGRQEVVEYEEMAYWLQIGGIILIVLGVGVVLFPRRK